MVTNTEDIRLFLSQWRAAQKKGVSPQLLRDFLALSAQGDAFSKALQNSFFSALSEEPAPMLNLDRYPLYDWLIQRHVAKGLTALSEVTAEGGRREFTYADLHLSVLERVDEWRQYGAAPGKIVLLFVPEGRERYIAFSTALFYGMQIAYFPMGGGIDCFEGLREICEQLEPVFVVTTGDGVKRVEEVGRTAISIGELDAERAIAQSSPATYAQLAPVLLSADAQEPRSANALLTCALRDGLLLGLKPGLRSARPLGHRLYEEPYFTLLEMLFGLHYIDLNQTVVEGGITEQVDLLSISWHLLSHLRELEAPLTKLPKSILKNPAEISEGIWRGFSQMNGLTKTPVQEALFSPQGGVALLSRPQIGKEDPFVVPNFGEFWELELGEGTLEGYGSMKINHCIQPWKIAKIESSFIEQWMVVGGDLPMHWGVLYPIDRIERGIKNLFFVENAKILFPRGEIHLVVFIAPSSSTEGEYRDHLERMLTRLAGKAFYPDHIEICSLLPKLVGSERTREAWIEEKYSSGSLKKRENTSFFRNTNRLKEALLKGRS